MEKIKVSRTSCDIAGGSISIPQTFRVGEVLSKVYAHEGLNSMPHKGSLKVVELTDKMEMGFEARARCVQKGCVVEVLVSVTAR
jgi:hypothetical protein